jgi:hypothetical protein
VSVRTKAEKISGPKLLDQYVSVAEYKKQEKGEITLKLGTLVEVVEKSESGAYSLVHVRDIIMIIKFIYSDYIIYLQADMPVHKLCEFKALNTGFYCTSPRCQIVCMVIRDR